MFTAKEPSRKDATFLIRSGTVSQVQEELITLKSARAILLAFDDDKEAAFRTIAQGLESFAPMFNALVPDQQLGLMTRLMDAMIPNVPVPHHIMAEASMRIQAKAAVLRLSEWLTASQVAELAGFSSSNPSAQPNKWKRDGLIFAIHHKSCDYYPDYGLNAEAGYKPVKALADVIAVLQERKDSWGMAFWFAADNSHLAGKTPKDLLAAAPQRVMAAAREEVSETAHG